MARQITIDELAAMVARGFEDVRREMRDGFASIHAVLGNHSGKLDSHAAVLDHHTAVLGQHTAILADHTAILTDHSHRLDRIERKLDKRRGSRS